MDVLFDRLVPNLYLAACRLPLVLKVQNQKNHGKASPGFWILQTVAFEKAHFSCRKVPKVMILTENQQKRPFWSHLSPPEALAGPSGGPGTPSGPRPGPRRGLGGPSRAPPGPSRAPPGPSGGPRRASGPRPGPRTRPRSPPGPRPGPRTRPRDPLPGPGTPPGGPKRAPGPQKWPFWGPPGGNSAILEIPRCPYRPLISYKIGGMPTKTLGP